MDKKIVLVKDLEELRGNYISFVFKRKRRADFINIPLFKNSITIGLGEEWYHYARTARIQLVAQLKGYESISDYQGSYWTIFRNLTIKSLSDTDSYLMNLIDELQYRQFPLYFSRAEKLFSILKEKGFIEGESKKESDKILASVFIGDIRLLINEKFKNDLEYFYDGVTDYPEEFAIIAQLREQLKRITDLCFKGNIISDVIRSYSIDSMDKGENLTIPEWHQVAKRYSGGANGIIREPLLPESSKEHIARLTELLARNKKKSDLIPTFIEKYYHLKIMNPTWIPANFIEDMGFDEPSVPTLYSWINEFNDLLKKYTNSQ